MSTATAANTYCSLCLKDVCEHTTRALMALRAELTASESLVTALQEQMARLAEQHAKAVAEAREEQREACAQMMAPRPRDEDEDSWAYASRKREAERRVEWIRATPLDSTPLAARIEELERDKNELIGRGFGDDAYILGLEQRVKLADAITANNQTTAELLSALAAEVERHQATAKAVRETLFQAQVALRTYTVRDGREGADVLRAAALDSIERLIASLPAGPREER